MDMTFDYQKFREDKLIGKVTDEIKFYSESEYSSIYPIKDYINYLEQRIGVGPNITKQYSNYYTQNTNTFKTMVMDEYNKDMDIDTFARPWKKLREIHKITKINEFVDSLSYNIKNAATVRKNKQYLIAELSNGMKTKLFSKDKSSVDYDEKEMRIRSISCINKKNGLYIIDWDN